MERTSRASRRSDQIEVISTCGLIMWSFFFFFLLAPFLGASPTTSASILAHIYPGFDVSGHNLQTDHDPCVRPTITDPAGPHGQYKYI